MSKAIYIKEVNKMREIPEMEKPKCWNGEEAWICDDCCKYQDQLLACEEYPCPPQHSFVEGVTYEEGKDYEIHHYNHGGFGKPDDYKATAIPINKESEDEMWDKAEDIFDTYTRPSEGGYGADYTDKWGFFNSLKNHFQISRKQK